MPTCKRVPNSKAFNKVFITLQVSGWKQFGEQSTHPKIRSVFHNISILFGEKESINCRIQSCWSAPAWSAMATVMTPPVDLRPWEEVHPRRLRQLKGPQNSAAASVTQHVWNNTFHRKVCYAQFWGSTGLACFGAASAEVPGKLLDIILNTAQKKQYLNSGVPNPSWWNDNSWKHFSAQTEWQQ